VREQNKQWLLDQVNHILEPLVSELIRERPKSIVDYMLNRLEENFGERAVNGDITQMDMLQEKASALRRRVQEMEYNKMNTNKKEELNSEDETDEDEEEDYVEDLKEVIASKKNRGPRSSVSAEAFGIFNKKEDFKARVVPKSDASK